MRYFDLKATTGRVLFEILSTHYRTLAPGLDVTGKACWLPTTDWPAPVDALAAPAVKRFLLPADETVWDERSSRTIDQPVALLGVPVCDLAAVALLDRVFFADQSWQRRRRNLLLVGGACSPDQDCFCTPRVGLPPCDLFVDGRRLWLTSSRADQLYVRAGLPLSDAGDFPSLPDISDNRADVASLRQSLPNANRLEALAERCLGCGACAAACPTCHCFDIRDVVTDAGAVQRHRVWDCCQFVAHGQVAGGHNFRPRRADRLRFRLEHKLHGFGLLRGTSFCVGCGRCARACSSGLGLRQVMEAVDAQ